MLTATKKYNIYLYTNWNVLIKQYILITNTFLNDNVNDNLSETTV